MDPPTASFEFGQRKRFCQRLSVCDLDHVSEMTESSSANLGDLRFPRFARGCAEGILITKSEYSDYGGSESAGNCLCCMARCTRTFGLLTSRNKRDHNAVIYIQAHVHFYVAQNPASLYLQLCLKLLAILNKLVITTKPRPCPGALSLSYYGA